MAPALPRLAVGSPVWQPVLTRLRMRPARLAVPGPVWGARPMRSEPDAQGETLRAAPRRGPVAGVWAEGLRRWVQVDARSMARYALARAAQRAVSAAETPHDWERLRGQLAARGLASEVVADALGAVGATLARTTGWVPRLNQYECAALLLAQRLVELDTGEGKSVALALAAAVAGLAGAPVHVLTANSYLAQRDAAGFAPFYAALGLSVAAVADQDPDEARRRAWRSDVVYASARILGFDVLRDLSHAGGTPWLSRGLCVALVDEADSVLVDEARTPLVIAEPVADPQERARAWQALDWARRLDLARDAHCTMATRSAQLTPGGQARLAALVAAEAQGVAFFGARHRIEWVEHALAALHLLRRDVDYLVQDREIVLIDAGTGRPDSGRRLARALHAMVAIKEGVPVPMATEVRASITYPRLFARYHHVCGTSGTLAEAAAELRRYYGLVVMRVPRARPSRLHWYPMRVFADRDAQFAAAVARAQRLAAQGRCVLVATDSVADSVALAERFAQRGTTVAMLDARHDGAEHALIARAGEAGRITVSTQMAGRGTDIGVAPQARQRGGLHVLILQHHRSRRIDRQVAGRAARQGDPGSAEHWVRWHDSPLNPERLPPGLRHLARALGAWLLAGPMGRTRRGLLPWVWRAYQLGWRLEDALLRRDSLSHDRHWSRRLHFARIRPGDE